MVADNARPVKNSGDKFAAFVSRQGDTAFIQIFPRPTRYTIDFDHPVAEYETASAGAVVSARREIKKLS